MRPRKLRPASARLRKLFDEAVERGRQMDPPFGNFDGDDYWLINRLLSCKDRVPDATADALLLLRSEDYASAARELRRFIAARNSRSAAA